MENVRLYPTCGALSYGYGGHIHTLRGTLKHLLLITLLHLYLLATTEKVNNLGHTCGKSGKLW